MIRITRNQQNDNILRAYKIFIDGVYRGKIKEGETKEFPVENGKHTIRAKIDWGGSKELIVDVNDAIVDVEVGSSVVGWEGFLLIFAYMTTLRNESLWLREMEFPPDLNRSGRREHHPPESGSGTFCHRR